MKLASRARLRSRSSGFTLIEIMIVVVIIGVISAGVLLSVNLTGRDTELEKESDRLLTLVNYAREQSEMQTREYGVVVHDDGYQFVAYDTRRRLWREIYEDESLRLRKLPDGLDFKLVVDARPVVLVPTGELKPPDPKDRKAKPKTLDQVKSLDDATLKDGTAAGKRLGEDSGGLGSDLDAAKKVTPQIMIYSNGDLSSFEITVEREGGVRSVTLALDDKGQLIAQPMVEKEDLSDRRNRGFTLIEVLVALVIVAVGMSVLMGALSSSARTVFYLQDKIFAEWLALNQIATLRIGLQQEQIPPTGTTNGDLDFANRSWHWRQDVVASQVPGINRIDFKVRPKEVKGGDDDSWYVTVSGLAGNAMGTPGSSTAMVNWDPDLNGGLQQQGTGSGTNQGTNLNTTPGTTTPATPTQTPTPTTTTNPTGTSQ